MLFALRQYTDTKSPRNIIRKGYNTPISLLKTRETFPLALVDMGSLALNL